MKTVPLGSQGLQVSELGFGCMGLTSFYGTKLPDDEIIGLLKAAAERGLTFWDTANAYLYQDMWRVTQLESPMVCQEEIIGKAIKEIGRDKIQIATKTGLDVKILPTTHLVANSSPDFIRKQCEESLKRLQVDYIDLFYLHRIDQNVPIELSMAEMKRLVTEGKVKYVGLSESSAKTIRRAHKVHPLTAVQLEYSLWCRGIEDEVMATCKELGIGVVAYSPLGRGFLTGENKKYDKGDFRNTQARMTGEEGEKNAKLLEKVRKIAEQKGVSMTQLALAWIKGQQNRLGGAGVVPIPGTTKLKNLESNIGAFDIDLSIEELGALEDAVPHDQVQGARYDDDGLALWETDNNREMAEDEAKLFAKQS